MGEHKHNLTAIAARNGALSPKQKPMPNGKKVLTMAKEYIEREAAIEAIMSDPPDAHYPSWYIDRIKTLSAADVVEVVRCCNCEFHDHVSLLVIVITGEDGAI